MRIKVVIEEMVKVLKDEIPEVGSVSFESQASKPVPYEWGFGSTPRTARLRAALKWKAAVVKDFENIFMGLAKCGFRNGEDIKVDIDRARLITESYKQTDGQPWVSRVAKAFVHLCENMPIYIKDGELIVGDPNSAPDELRWHPEICSHFMSGAVTDGSFSSMVTDAEREEIVSSICAFWDERSIAARIRAVLPRISCQDIFEGLATPIEAKLWEMGIVNPSYDYSALFKEGLNARIEKAERRLRELESGTLGIPPSQYVEKRNNWEAMIMCGKALIRFSQRYAELARKQAQLERDAMRRQELEEIADVLERVPANPARTFREALQFYWIVEVAAKFLAVYGHGGGHRFDQIFFPYYEADMKKGKLARKQALELIECLFLKIQEVGIALEYPVTFTGKAGGEIFYTINICGSKNNGEDASNDLSCLVLEAMCNLRINQPPIAVLYHKNISPAIVERAIDLLHLGTGHPSWFNEDLLQELIMLRGYSPKDAKRVTVGGCVTPHITGKYLITTGTPGIGGMILPKVLEETLYDGGSTGNEGRPDKPKTKDPRIMTSADELLEAFLERALFYCKEMTFAWNLAQEVLMATSPDPCNSLLLDEPLDRGIDLKKLHKEYDTYPAVFALGLMTVADSLAAIQRLVFDEKKYTMDELIIALKNDWKGYEAMRQEFLNAPKYGNDDDYADSWAVKLATHFENTISQLKDAWGYKLLSDGGTAAGYQTVGLTCGATPDGRHAMTHLTDGSRSPMAGADKKGPTAVLNSAGKIPFTHMELFNQRFMPTFLEGKNRELFAAYLRVWCEKRTIPHIQFNVVDSALLRDAQNHPEMYTDLQVRVAGYSAFWIDLPRGTQDSIIARTAHSF
ncbi:MAG: pyruvate formate lyase family protein [Promethearchaeati archaeon SRVP18_Atabeyarchaeia-1]